MQRLAELNRLHVHCAHLLTLSLQTLLRDELFCIYNLHLTMLVLSSESDFELRMLVIADSHKV